MAGERRTFPLVPRRRLSGLPVGDLPSRRRGHGTEVIGLREYEPGDPVSTIDWPASARLSATSGADAFVVRERAADEAPRVVVVFDRRPTMALFPEPLPWLAKQEAVRQAAAAIAASAAAARADLAVLDAAGGEPWWLPPGRRDRRSLIAARAAAAQFDAADDSLLRSLEFLARRRTDVPEGTFLFVLSDFLAPPPPAAWAAALGHGWDVVPVVIQDPVWERSFPDVGGAALPVTGPLDGRPMLVRLGRRQVARRRAEHEGRYARLLGELRSLGLQPVEIGSSDPLRIDRVFVEWAEARRRGRWAR